MEIKQNTSLQDTSSIKEIEILDQQPLGKRTINTRTPVLMYDALGTVVTICDPLKTIKTKEEMAMYTLSSLKTYNPENEAILKRIIHELGLDEQADAACTKLLARKLPPQASFYALVDIITEEFCKKIGDVNQELRVEVLLKMHKLADPRIFDYINEYSQKTFGADISQLILTQDNSIMKEVYTQMLKGYGLDIITVPNPQFHNLRKNNPELYTKLTAYLDRTPKDIGFYDDTQENLHAANQIGILTQLATGVKNNNPDIIKTEAAGLVERLFDASPPKKKEVNETGSDILYN